MFAAYLPVRLSLTLITATSRRNLEGGLFMRCWPAGGSRFLMLMYDRPLTETGFAATDLAIFDAEAKRLTFVGGLPSNISSIGKTTYAKMGMYTYL